jgi:5'-nucleotidase/UDP-sugar diphosphatase
VAAGAGRAPATNLTINGQPVQLNESYRIAVNDYIARGGSGFLVLKRNTTRIESGIPLRDSLIGFMQNFCTCDDILKGRTDQYGNVVNANNIACGNRDPAVPTRWTVDEQEKSFCRASKTFRDELLEVRGGCTCADVFRRDLQACSAGGLIEDQVQQCVKAISPGPPLGRCSCRDALAGNPICGNVTRVVRSFCENPTGMPVAVGAEDGRIKRRVK